MSEAEARQARDAAFRTAFQGAGVWLAVLRLEQVFRQSHPDYDAVCERAGIWRIVRLVEAGAPLSPDQAEVVRLLKSCPNPVEATYGLALTRILTGETT